MVVTLTFPTNDDKTRGGFVCYFSMVALRYTKGKKKFLEESAEKRIKSKCVVIRGVFMTVNCWVIEIKEKPATLRSVDVIFLLLF